jgi:demethylmenaquinone methyltransferase/2-methoxy-6-polyprenyl-1,4-benzoquinol methylase
MEWAIGYWHISIQRVYPTSNQLIQSYNRAASGWHRRIRWLGYTHAYRQLFRMLQQAGILTLKDNSTVCDCGIGTAAFSLALAQTTDVRLHLTGVDMAPAMLQTADAHLDQAGIHAQLCHRDVCDLPFKTGEFELVISAHMLEHLSAPIAGLQEMVRIARPGALLILAVSRPGLLGSWIQLHWGNNCFNAKTLTRLMKQAGLTQIRVYPFQSGLARWTSLAYVGVKPSSGNLNPLLDTQIANSESTAS